ncbi:polysaccharide export protein [Lichenihabitans sp. Uapishka_5]|uniref:polysaccharide biosynthesis/export family protein n=1 Tax=Lichenihabitans sp. Uapishka_5 TaxID=3037302 RepID=UPI0029E7D876|nr:polysaccharide biosynthesis/export family protein [Lichenihabitans sp. Uapishka_5]MDX7949850.1 polysaccharide export protein [Lichenihabitans sp. Uapishka_5]
MLRPLLISCVTAALVLGGCARQNFRNDLFQATLTTPYTLGSGDRVRVLVFGQDALSNTYSVSGAGSISMPLVADVPVYGLTTAQAERAIEARLRGGYLRDPHVSVEVDAYRPFFVLGEVTAAGQYPFINGMTIRKAIAVSGGFTPRGYQKLAEITRVIDGVPVLGRFPLDTPIRPGDTVTVEERFF